MKQLLWIAIVVSVTACTKPYTSKALQENRGCIERIIIPVTAYGIKPADVATVNNLFRNSGIDNTKFRYYRYTHDTFQTLYPPYVRYDQKTIRVDQYTNGLRIFTGDFIYIFFENSVHYKGGNLTNGTSLNMIPKLTLSQLRKMFLENIERFDHTSAKYKDSCFKAEFGYYNLNAGISYAQEVLVKAWRVTLKNSIYPSEYPIAFYEDNDGKLIYYDNGIRTFK
jgi:hypothetical protein